MSASLQSILGILAIPLISWVLSERRSLTEPKKLARIVMGGLAIQIVIAALLVFVPQAGSIFELIGRGVTALQATTEGTKVVFGYLGGAPAPFEVKNPANEFILAI